MNASNRPALAKRQRQMNFIHTTERKMTSKLLPLFLFALLLPSAAVPAFAQAQPPAPPPVTSIDAVPAVPDLPVAGPVGGFPRGLPG